MALRIGGAVASAAAAGTAWRAAASPMGTCASPAAVDAGGGPAGLPPARGSEADTGPDASAATGATSRCGMLPVGNWAPAKPGAGAAATRDSLATTGAWLDVGGLAVKTGPDSRTPGPTGADADADAGAAAARAAGATGKVSRVESVAAGCGGTGAAGGGGAGAADGVGSGNADAGRACVSG